MTAATSALELKSLTGHATETASPLVYRLAGLALATVLPALFWVAVAASLGNAAGIQFGATGLILTGTTIAVFLGSVCAPIVLKAE